MNHSFFALMGRMKYITRWALMRNTHPENLADHSHETAVIAHALALIGNRKLGKHYNAERAALLGLYHDAPEILTGDMPTPVKYYDLEMKNAYRRVEEKAQETLLDKLPDYLQGDFGEILRGSGESDAQLRTLVRAADKLCALIKCIEEEKAGNTEFVQAGRSTRRILEELHCPEAEIFVREFLPAYSMTLDEQK